MTCARCQQPICAHADPVYAGVVDDTSEPGSWARALRHRDQIDAARARFHDREVTRG